MATNEREIKAIFYNIYNGAVSKREAISKYIRTKHYSFAAFSELNKFSDSSFQKWASSELELDYTEFLETPHGFHLGIASRYKMQLIKSDVDHPMHHGYILVRIDELDLHVLVTHLCPSTAMQRLEETNHIIDILSCMNLLTDLNTLSTRDAIKTDSMRLLAANSKLTAKFLREDNEGHLSIDFRPMDTLLKELIDTGTPNDYSVPTDILEDKMHATEMRLDYGLVTKALWKACNGKVHSKTIKSTETAELSDHYPLEIILQLTQ